MSLFVFLRNSGRFLKNKIVKNEYQHFQFDFLSLYLFKLWGSLVVLRKQFTTEQYIEEAVYRR
jgi:hypothetical protein